MTRFLLEVIIDWSGRYTQYPMLNYFNLAFESR